ncbi:MAG TPA: hypothetical protein PKM41_05435 [Deltaproteobacteria bacterium]|nr:hypothetical protein [Deltaproteobacteria bacterium]HOI06633.1 hypothetical protein [Deltaproteobacteria bacterium]
MGLVRDLARHGKDRAISKALEVLGESVVSRYGHLKGFRLDSAARTIDLEVLLKGESEPVTVTLHDYRFLTEGDRSYVTVGDVSVSREWMMILAEDLLKDKRFEIPAKYARLLDAVI